MFSLRPSDRLHEVAPRLARAVDLERRERAERAAGEAKRERKARARRRRHAAREQHLIWLVDHRDLQLARALHTGSGAYIDERREKLDAARIELEEHRAKAA